MKLANQPKWNARKKPHAHIYTHTYAEALYEKFEINFFAFLHACWLRCWWHRNDKPGKCIQTRVQPPSNVLLCQRRLSFSPTSTAPGSGTLLGASLGRGAILNVSGGFSPPTHCYIASPGVSADAAANAAVECDIGTLCLNKRKWDEIYYPHPPFVYLLSRCSQCYGGQQNRGSGTLVHPHRRHRCRS